MLPCSLRSAAPRLRRIGAPPDHDLIERQRGRSRRSRAVGEHGRYREIESALREQYAAGVIEWTARQGGLGEAVFIAALVCTRPWLQHGLIVFQVREQSRDSDVSIEPLGQQHRHYDQCRFP